ncbi:type IV pilus modification protein PilV [Salinicola corii]|uniref:type IV pilus modification protein PilV n=1 Tax=Salinicola corii TaxID=2606937 RepID=UPI0016596BAB|nr:type IV pilus modification protein PilV [Salinicola corii]
MLYAQRGLSLIEVLIAIVVFSVGLLGTAWLIVGQNQLEQESGYRATATLMAEDLLERIRLAGSNADRYLGNYEIPGAGSGTENEGVGDIPDGLRDWAAAWANRYALPHARVCSSKAAAEAGEGSDIDVTVVWRSRIEMTPPDDLPVCVSARDSQYQQRWAVLTSWMDAE